MNREIRWAGYIVVGLFVALIINLTVIQVIRAESLNSNPNNSMQIIQEYNKQRGPIVAADGTTLAQSVETTDTLEFLRVYPQTDAAAHVTGFDSFVVGRSLAEASFDGFLTGKEAPLTFSTIVDRLEGNLPGDQVSLNINWAGQQAAIQGLGGRAGAVFAVEPRTGAALVSYSAPSYDPSVLSSHDSASIQQNWDQLNADPSKPLLARAFRQTYPPGSSFKIITAVAALESGKATLETTFPSVSSVDIPGRTTQLSNFGGSSCGGTLVESFARSCNTVFAPLAMDVGTQKMTETAEAFGYNQDPPFDLPAVASRFPSPASQAALAAAGIGQQSVATTALENALTSAAIANGGSIMTPQVLKSVIDEKGNIIREIEPKQWRQATTPEIASQVEQMMVAVVESGTGRAAQISGIQVAGKTGTAQVGDSGSDHAWFTAYAPVGDPKIAVAVIVENGGGGGSVAAPVAKEVIEAVLGVSP